MKLFDRFFRKNIDENKANVPFLGEEDVKLKEVDRLYDVFEATKEKFVKEIVNVTEIVPENKDTSVVFEIMMLWMKLLIFLGQFLGRKVTKQDFLELKEQNFANTEKSDEMVQGILEIYKEIEKKEKEKKAFTPETFDLFAKNVLNELIQLRKIKNEVERLKINILEVTTQKTEFVTDFYDHIHKEVENTKQAQVDIEVLKNKKESVDAFLTYLEPHLQELAFFSNKAKAIQDFLQKSVDCDLESSVGKLADHAFMSYQNKLEINDGQKGFLVYQQEENAFSDEKTIIYLFKKWQFLNEHLDNNEVDRNLNVFLQKQISEMDSITDSDFFWKNVYKNIEKFKQFEALHEKRKKWLPIYHYKKELYEKLEEKGQKCVEVYEKYMKLKADDASMEKMIYEAFFAEQCLEEIIAKHKENIEFQREIMDLEVFHTEKIADKEYFYFAEKNEEIYVFCAVEFSLSDTDVVLRHKKYNKILVEINRDWFKDFSDVQPLKMPLNSLDTFNMQLIGLDFVKKFKNLVYAKFKHKYL